MSSNSYNYILEKIDKSRVEPQLQNWINDELYYMECNEDEADSFSRLLKSGKKYKNDSNSSLAYVTGLTDEKPKTEISKTPVSLPDVDYDSNARDQIKEYLVGKYGKSRVALIGTYNALKTKGAIKDVCRQIRPDWEFNKVNDITKKFDILNRADFKSELEYFEAALELDVELKKFFDENSDIKNEVTRFLGNYKSSGIHAGGIVVSSQDIYSIVPMNMDSDSGLFVTQPEMKYVEAAGLIKFDFLGINTLNDIQKCFSLVKETRGIQLKLEDIPMDDKKVFANFTQNKNESVFQFNTSLADGILSKLYKVENITDLAMVTSIARPGPLTMEMDKLFIKRKNGVEKITYLHPKLEQILKETFGIYIFQEQIMRTVQELGGLSGDESVTVLKGLGKKDFEKIAKYKEKFIKNAVKDHEIKESVANEIYELMAAFAAYGFNKSHATAYASLGYICMWLKEYYPAEWRAAVLSNASSDDFKVLYPKWKNMISSPNINYSKRDYFIDIDNNKIVMPFSSITRVAEKATDKIASLAPFSSFEDFLTRAPGGPVNKSVIKNLILSGCFDLFRDQYKEMDIWDYRKFLFEAYFCFVNDVKLATDEEIEESGRNNFDYSKRKLKQTKSFTESIADLDVVRKMSNRDMLIEELSLLSFSSFDYYAYFGSKLGSLCKTHFPKDKLSTIEEALKKDDGSYILVLGAVEDIKFFTIKKEGKNFGKEMAKIKIGHNGFSIDLTVFPDSIEEDKKRGQIYKNLKPLYPILVKGKINKYNDSIGIVVYEALTLV